MFRYAHAAVMRRRLEWLKAVDAVADSSGLAAFVAARASEGLVRAMFPVAAREVLVFDVPVVSEYLEIRDGTSVVVAGHVSKQDALSWLHKRGLTAGSIWFIDVDRSVTVTTRWTGR